MHMNKKAAWGTAVVVLGAVYGGATWYLGERAQSRYQQALEEVRALLGDDALVSHSYERGFWTSNAQAVLQWTLPAADDADAAAATPAQTLRLTLGSTVRHGPLVGARMAAAVVDTRMVLDGIDDSVRQLFTKASAPTLTTVHHFSGSNDLTLELPAGELGEGDNLLRWQALRYQMALSADRSVVRGDMVWPEVTLRIHDDGLDGADDTDDADSTAAREPSNITVALQGTRGQFDVRLEDGLWLLTPGWSKGRMDKVSVLQEPMGGAQKTLATLQDVVFDAAIERTGDLLGWSASMQTKGRIGPIDFDALGLTEKVSRIDVEAVRMFQKALIMAYRSEASSSAAGLVQEDVWSQLLVQAAPRLLAGLPSYAVELKATLEGKEGNLQYGAQIKSVPEQALVDAQGWGAALLKSSVLNANLRLPKTWIPLIAKSMGEDAPKDDEINAMLGMAQAQGYLTQESDSIVSAVQLDAGKFLLNGKTVELPSLGSRD